MLTAYLLFIDHKFVMTLKKNHFKWVNVLEASWNKRGKKDNLLPI